MDPSINRVVDIPGNERGQGNGLTVKARDNRTFNSLIYFHNQRAATARSITYIFILIFSTYCPPVFTSWQQYVVTCHFIPPTIFRIIENCLKTGNKFIFGLRIQNL